MFGDVPGWMAVWADWISVTAISSYAGLVSSLDACDLDLLKAAVDERRCREAVGAGTLSEAAELRRPHPPCPPCGLPDCSRDGRTPAGRQRWRCPVCGEAFSSLSGTVLECANEELPVWEGFIACMCHNAPIDPVAEACGIAHATAFEWRHRVFAAVDGCRDGLVLGGRAWVDELCLTDSDIARGSGFVRKRGLSKNKTCIAAAIDAFKNAAVVVCGNGKPSSKRIKDALLARIAPGSVVVRDEEKWPKTAKVLRHLLMVDAHYRSSRQTRHPHDSLLLE